MKTAIVTGSNSEIGFAICKTLLEENYVVTATIHEQDDRIKTLKSDKLIIKKLDLTNEEDIVSLKSKYDLIVNAAAFYYDDDYHNVTKDNFMKTLEVNVVASFLMFKHLSKEDGIIINISSTDGIDTYNELTITYSASKAALNNLTKSRSYASSAKVYALVLGWVNTKIIKSINQDYLESDMKRTNQVRLVEIDEITKEIKNILNNKYETGSLIRIDGDNNGNQG